VLADAEKAGSVAGLEEAEPSVRSLGAGKIVLALEAERGAFYSREGTVFQLPPPEPARGIDQVQVRRIYRRHRVHEEAGAQDLAVEGPAVVADEPRFVASALPAFEFPPDGFQELGLARVVEEEVLRDPQDRARRGGTQAAESRQKGYRPRAPRQPCRLQVEKKETIGAGRACGEHARGAGAERAESGRKRVERRQGERRHDRPPQSQRRELFPA